MAFIPPRVTRAFVLRRMPRFLRVGLCTAERHGPVAAGLVAEAGRIDPALGAAAAEFLADRLTPTHPGLAVLDAYSGHRDAHAVAGIADALLLAPPEDTFPTAPRLAASAWAALVELDRTEARLAGLGLLEAAAAEPADWETWPAIDQANGETEADRRARTRAAWHASVETTLDELKDDARALAVGLSAIRLAHDVTHISNTVAETALWLGRSLLLPVRTSAVRQEGRREENRSKRIARRLPPPPAATAAEAAAAAVEPAATPAGHVLVCAALPRTGNSRAREVARGYEHAVGTPLPLVPTPDLVPVRARLAAEFPHAVRALDAVLGKLVGKPAATLPPLLIVGAPGTGKSRFARRLGEELGVGILRVDGANDGGVAYGGTERRWYSSEPCRPFMAVARHRQANPMVIVDEIDKSPTRSDYGRLWDGLLATLGAETSSRYPDPCLQAELDLSHVSVVCLANDETRLPAPLLDRLALVRFDAPTRRHLAALAPAILAAVATEAGLDPRFHAPLSPMEIDAVGRRWRDGSLRPLRRLVEAVLRVRERGLASTRH